MFASYSLTVLYFIFILAAVAVWVAGNYLSKTLDVIDDHFKIGEALGGMIFLAIVTNLPEIAIVISASVSQHMSLAIGNILGGIAIQTVVLVLLDAYASDRQGSLIYKAATLVLVIEAALVITILALTMLGTQLPKQIIWLRLTPVEILILLTWLAGLWLINKARKNLPWQACSSKDTKAEVVNDNRLNRRQTSSIVKVILVFIIMSLITFFAGVLLELTSNVIAAQLGWKDILFGATVLAAVTALPEISTGIAAIKLKDYTMAISDIFGGNAFLPTLFLLATLLSGSAVLPQTQGVNIYLASLGVLLTAVYLLGILFRSNIKVLTIGLDSFVVMIVYVLGLVGLFYMH